MSTMTAPTGTAASASRSRRTPFARLVNVELRKLYDTRAGLWLLVAIVAVTGGAMAIGAITMKAGDKTLDNLLALAGVPQSVLLPVLGILTVTSEWSQRTGLVTFTLEPRRGRVIAAKIVAAMLVAVAALVIVVGLAAALFAAAGHGEWTLTMGGFGELLVAQVIGVGQGLAFGMVFLNTPLAIVAYFILPVVWSIALAIAGDSLKTVQTWFDLGTASQPLIDHSMNAERWMHLASASAVWVLLPLAIGLWRVLRTEVKSA